MTDETQVETPIEDAPVVETEIADSSTAPQEPDSSVDNADDAGQPRDEDGKFLSKNAQKRIDELTREKYERAREAEYWRQQAMAAKPVEPPKPTEPVRLPTLEEHGYDEAKYQAALIQYATQQAEKVVEERLSRVEQQRVEQEQLKTFAQRSQEFAKANPDYVDKVMRAPTLPISDEVQSILRGLEDGPEIAYHLVNNTDEAYRLMSLPTHIAMLEVGRIQGRLAAMKETAKRPPVVSKAPPPPPTVDSSSVEVEKDPDKMSIDEWNKWREKQLRKRK